MDCTDAIDAFAAEVASQAGVAISASFAIDAQYARVTFGATGAIGAIGAVHETIESASGALYVAPAIDGASVAVAVGDPGHDPPPRMIWRWSEMIRAMASCW